MLDPKWNPDPNSAKGASPSLEITAKALWALANAATWDETYRVLNERQAILLSDHALALLHFLIDDSLAANEIADAENWQQYLYLLEEAKTDGIDIAWENFMTIQNQAVEALEALSSAVTPDAKYTVLENRQAVLLGDTTLVILRGSCTKQRKEGNIKLAEHLEQLLRLLEDARVRGLKAAWDSFKNG